MAAFTRPLAHRWTMEKFQSVGRRGVVAYRAIGVLLLNVLACWVCLELVSYMALRVRWAFAEAPAAAVHDERSLSSYYASQDWAPVYWHEMQLTRKRRYEPFALWRRAPFEGKTINIDHDGIRRTPGAQCGANSFRVFVLGSSTVWGTGSPDWGTLPAYLQIELSKLHREPTCVVNFGESAYVSTQGVLTLLRQLQAGNVPHLVVSYEGPPDVYSGYQSGNANVHQNVDQLARVFEARPSPPQPSPLTLLLESTSTFHIARGVVKRLAQAPQEDLPPPLLTYHTMGIDATALSDAIVQTYFNNYETVDALAQKYGFRYMFFWSPYIATGHKPLLREEEALEEREDPMFVKLYQEVVRTIERVGPKYGNFYHMANVFDGYRGLIWLDGFHVTPVGNEILARRIVEVLYGPPSARQTERPSAE